MNKRHANKAKTQQTPVKTKATSWLGKFVMWTCVAFMAQLAADPTLFGGSLPLTAFVDHSVLAPSDAWNVPLSIASGNSLVVPLWSVALSFSLTLSWLTTWASERTSPLMSLILILALASGITHPVSEYLVLLLAGGWFYFLQTRPTLQARSALVGSMGVFCIAAACSLEFGLTAAVLSCTAIASCVHKLWKAGDKPRALSVAALWAAVLLVPVVFFSGYADALVRPVSWSWLNLPTSLMPSMLPVWDSDAHLRLSLENVALGALCVGLTGSSITNRGYWTEKLISGLWLGLILGCTFYLHLACWAFFVQRAFTSKVSERSPQVPGAETVTSPLTIRQWLAKFGQHPLVVKAAFGIGLVALSIQLATAVPMWLTASDQASHSVEPAQWDLSGNVLLTNLDQSPYWQQSPRRNRFRPIISNRWDLFAEQYVDYANICEEWCNWKREAYVLPDGTWGGYQTRFETWDPQLVIVDSRDLDSLRLVSLDSKWKVIGLDHQKTIFASTDKTAAIPLILRANTLLLALEFPRPVQDVAFERVLAIGSAHDARRVSTCLTSLRLPFAGLKTLPLGDRSQSAPAALAFCELSHRALRYAGTPSLLDTARVFSGPPATGERYVCKQLARCMQELQLRIAEQNWPQMEDPEIRQAILQGNFVESLLSGVENSSKKEFYATIAHAWQYGPQELMRQLEQIDGGSLGPEMACELSFYLGCLAIELSDVGAANAHLNRAANTGSQSPYMLIAQLYLAQLNQR